MVGNSVIHHIAALIPPPQRMVWDRINTDTSLSIFKAALQRADSGFLPTTPGSLIGGMQNFGANFTVFAPTNAAMKAGISFITGGALPPMGSNTIYIGFLGSANVTSIQVKGLVAYHLSGRRVAPPAPPAPPDSVIAGIRIFSVNVPTTPIAVLTFINNPGPAYFHPGVIMEATFSGPIASTFTVKGASNATPSNVLINPTPDLFPGFGPAPPTGTSDQHYINGVLHKIDQLLIP